MAPPQRCLATVAATDRGPLTITPPTLILPVPPVMQVCFTNGEIRDTAKIV
ncbi:hypothetical protein OOK60_07800 [Trichothermofontia sichuanensis B231]|uniref:hypothetical protein n=1 Tax=Trichothermofontia sichuanensis TaxID=3045816 RepID=UPI002246A1AC|nr:hypothetical protein [Trichothermofontia sichuanensis]UZQ55952.1 hypothetical protein OOK60_07800 [Trichothermofontia sichuanensis B231]